MKGKSANKKTVNKTPARPVGLTAAQLNSRQEHLLLVDVRGWLEYWVGHVPGAQLMSRDRILREVPKDQAIAVTCASGHRSAAASEWLVAQGYRQVYNLQGGLMAWHSAGYPVRRGNRAW